MARCPICGTLVVVKASGYLPSHNAPPNGDGYVTRCGNRRATLKEDDGYDDYLVSIGADR